ncbi:hypothetical protein BC828DRAFT_400162 [Blastocladiella britannica]|nr:hypothetical protein BC828DRAFT_400162 [Blastocladiella britannica]
MKIDIILALAVAFLVVAPATAFSTRISHPTSLRNPKAECAAQGRVLAASAPQFPTAKSTIVYHITFGESKKHAITLPKTFVKLRTSNNKELIHVATSRLAAHVLNVAREDVVDQVSIKNPYAVTQSYANTIAHWFTYKQDEANAPSIKIGLTKAAESAAATSSSTLLLSSLSLIHAAASIATKPTAVDPKLKKEAETVLAAFHARVLLSQFDHPSIVAASSVIKPFGVVISAARAGSSSRPEWAAAVLAFTSYAKSATGKRRSAEEPAVWHHVTVETYGVNAAGLTSWMSSASATMVTGMMMVPSSQAHHPHMRMRFNGATVMDQEGSSAAAPAFISAATLVESRSGARPVSSEVNAVAAVVVGKPVTVQQEFRFMSRRPGIAGDVALVPAVTCVLPPVAKASLEDSSVFDFDLDLAIQDASLVDDETDEEAFKLEGVLIESDADDEADELPSMEV